MNPFHNFIFYRFIVGSWENRIRRILLFFGVIYGFCFFATWFDGLLIIEGKPFGLLEDLAFFSSLIANFFIVMLTAKLPSVFVSTFKGTEQAFNYDRGIFQSLNFGLHFTSDQYESEFYKNYDFITANNKKGKLLLWFFIFGGAVSNIFTEIGIANGEVISWVYQSEYTLTFIAQGILNFSIYWFIYPETAFVAVTVMYGILKMVSKLSRSKVIVLSPVAKDEMGGMTQITKLCFHMVKILFFPLLVIFSAMIVIGFKTELFIGLFVYILFMIWVFVFPLWFIHRSMLQYKEQELLEIEQLFKSYYIKYKEIVKRPNRTEDEITNVANSLVSIDNLFSVTKKLPIWPYDFKIFTRFFSIIIIPIVVLFVQLVTNADSILFNLEKLKIFKNFFGL